MNVNTAFAGFSQILLQASGNITLNANTAWNLTASSGQDQRTIDLGSRQQHHLARRFFNL